MVLDAATRQNLELFAALQGGTGRGSLLWHLDCCQCAMGSRLLRQWLMFPLRDAEAIARRADAVQVLRAQRSQRQALRQALAGVRDLERLLGRVALDRATPRDVGALRETLLSVPALQAAMAELCHSPAAAATPKLALCSWLPDEPFAEVADLTATLAKALVAQPPTQAQDGGIFADGFCPELDALLRLSRDGHAYLADLEQRERARSGIANLKVRYNRVFGYYLEVTRANLAQVPADYVRKQTLVNAERFITTELKEFEDKVLHADEMRKEREAQMFVDLCQQVGTRLQPLRTLARLLAEADALAALAEVADTYRYVRPTLSHDNSLQLQAARHPVVERLLPGGERFVANDLSLGGTPAAPYFLMITGPNMAGKSTVMRQAALCVLLAHMGSFVPAAAATIGLCDRLFVRVGASDNLARGHSTFMVEMMETSQHPAPRQRKKCGAAR